MVLTLHHLDQSRSQRLLWLLEELEVEYEVKIYLRENGVAPKSLRDVHPLGKSPVITDGDVTVAESGAIVDYLIKKYGKGRFQTPEGDEQKARDDLYFSHFAEGTLMPLMVIKLLFSTMYTRSPFFIKPVASMLTGGVNASYVDPNMKRMFALIDSYLAKDGGRQFIAGGDAQGAPTAADFLLIFPLEAGIGSGRLPDDATATPRIREYVQRCQERPAYKRALEKGPKYNYGPKL